MKKQHYWKSLLKNHLIPHPAKVSKDKLYSLEHKNDFFTPENLIVVVKIKWKNYGFGGPIYSAAVSLGDTEIKVTFIPPKFRGKQHYKINWDKIKELDFHYLRKKK